MFDLINNGIKIHRFALEFHFASLNFGKIKDIVDQCQQIFPAGLNGFKIIFRLFLHNKGTEQVGKSQYRIHGCTDFMRHIGQKFAFGPICAFSDLFGLTQFPVGQFQLNNTVEHLCLSFLMSFQFIFPMLPQFIFLGLNLSHHLVESVNKNSDLILIPGAFFTERIFLFLRVTGELFKE